MASHMTSYNADVEAKAKVHNVGLRRNSLGGGGGGGEKKSAAEAQILSMAGGAGLQRPKVQNSSGLVSGPKPVVPAYQRADIPMMQPASAALPQPLYFADLSVEVEACQV